VRSATRLTGDVVVLAIWYAAVDDVLGRYGDQLDGKVVVDITNPIDAGLLKRAREIEALGYLHMAIQQPLGTGFSTTVKVLSYAQSRSPRRAARPDDRPPGRARSVRYVQARGAGRGSRCVSEPDGRM
jgi:hypothetical protein